MLNIKNLALLGVSPESAQSSCEYHRRFQSRQGRDDPWLHGQHQSDHLILALGTGEVTTFASDLLEHDHSLPDTLQFLAPKRRGGQWVRTQANPPGCSCAGHSPLSSRAGGWIKPSRAWSVALRVPGCLTPANGSPGHPHRRPVRRCCAEQRRCSAECADLQDQRWSARTCCGAGPSCPWRCLSLRTSRSNSRCRGCTRRSLPWPYAPGGGPGRPPWVPCSWRADDSFPRPMHRGPTSGAAVWPTCVCEPWSATPQPA